MPADFPRVIWNAEVARAANVLIALARDEDLSDGVDWTTACTVDGDRRSVATLVSRDAGVVCGLEVGPLVLKHFKADAEWESIAADGDTVEPGTAVARMSGRAADLLTCERTVLNFTGRLSGIATLTKQFADALVGTKARVYDTRKTTPGWRLLEKYAVACGGGENHRLGLSEAVLIKDNHLALSDQAGLTAGDAVRRARRVLSERSTEGPTPDIVEVEVDTLDQLRHVLPAGPDIVLLDNMSTDQLREAVALRDAAPGGEGRETVLEASGGVNLGTIGPIGQTGVDRVSVGAVTHSAKVLDIGLDWGHLD